MKHQYLLFYALIFMLPAALNAEQITFSADSMTGTAGSKSDTTTLMGNAHVKTGTMEINADSILLSGDDFRFITAEGSITAKNTETNMDFTCGRLMYDRETKIATLQDSVHLVDNDNSVSADAQMVEYSQNAETAILQIGITLKQKNNVCTGSYAVYHKKTQKLELNGNPKIVQGSDTFRAQQIILDLNSQEITLDGKVNGTVTSTKEDKKDQKPSDAPDKNSQGPGTSSGEGPDGQSSGNRSGSPSDSSTGGPNGR